MDAPNASPSVEAAEIYKAAGDPTRAELLRMLAHGELCVCHLHEALSVPQPTVSRHLRILRQAGLVAGRREGAWVHYGLTPRAERWLAPLLAASRAEPALAELARSLRDCISPPKRSVG